VTAAPSRRFVAPGKLMIAGEYAVLGPSGEALAVAVQAGVTLDAFPASVWELARAEDGTTWREPDGSAAVPEALRFAHAAWTTARAALAAGDATPPPPHRLVTRPDGDAGTGDRKPGVGGSASATAAVTAALFGLAGRDVPAERAAILAAALRAHRAAQGGEGSGYDVATVVHGGLVHWRRGAAAALPWPDGLHVLAGYSGRSARTVGFLQRVESLRAADAARLAAELDALAAPVRALLAAFGAASVPAVLQSVRDCHDALAAWDRAHGLGIVTAEIAQLRALAAAEGAAAKVSGAGGGDSVLAFAADPSVLDATARAWRDAGFRPFAVARTDHGVHEAHA
jgi:phosphomevalonate kinase